MLRAVPALEPSTAASGGAAGQRDTPERGEERACLGRGPERLAGSYERSRIVVLRHVRLPWGRGVVAGAVASGTSRSPRWIVVERIRHGQRRVGLVVL